MRLFSGNTLLALRNNRRHRLARARYRNMARGFAVPCRRQVHNARCMEPVQRARAPADRYAGITRKIHERCLIVRVDDESHIGRVVRKVRPFLSSLFRANNQYASCIVI